MAQLGEAVARYHKLFDNQGTRDLVWADALQERMRQAGLVDSGRLVAPILRPHFLAKRQQATLVRAVEAFASALDEIEPVIATTPALMSRLQMLPAEKLLAQVPARQSRFSMTSLMDAHLANGSVRIGGIRPNMLPALAYSGALSDLFLELPILKEFRRGRYRISKMGDPKQLLVAVLKAWKEFGGKTSPRIAILELKQQFSEDPPKVCCLPSCSSREAYLRASFRPTSSSTATKSCTPAISPSTSFSGVPPHRSCSSGTICRIRCCKPTATRRFVW